MTAEQLKNWLKSKTDVGQGIQVGGIDGNADRFLGVYRKEPSGGHRICLGGEEQTLTRQLRAEILVHWTASATQAEEKAQAIWELFSGLYYEEMDGALVYHADPGAGPVPRGKDRRGVVEHIIRVTLTFRKE